MPLREILRTEMTDASDIPLIPEGTGSFAGSVVLTIAMSAVLSACAIGNFGSLAAKVAQNGDVSTLDLYSVGLHLRTRPDDLGAHLGYSHRTYTSVSDGTLDPGWYFLRVPSPHGEAVAQDLTTGKSVV